MMMRDLKTKPYTPDEQRVAEYIVRITGVGAGDDPIGFLMASHEVMVNDRRAKIAEGKIPY